MTDILNRPKIPPPLPPSHTSSYNEDTDGSEADTALNTPTSWTTDHSNRWSLASAMSTAFSRHSFIHHKKKRSNDIHHHSTASTSPPTLPPRPVSTYHIPSTSISHKTSSPPLPSYTYRASWAPRTLSSEASDGSLKLAIDDDNTSNGYLSVNATSAPPPLPKHDGRPPTPPRHHDDHPNHDSYLHVVEDPFEGASWSGSDLRQLLHEDNHDYHNNSRSSFILQHANGSSVSNISSTNSSSGTRLSSNISSSSIIHSTESTINSKRACDHELVRVAKLLSSVYEFENSPQLHQQPEQVQDFCNHLRQVLEDWAEQPTTVVGSMAARRLKRDNQNVATRTNMAANAATVGGTLYYNVRHPHYYRRRRLRRQQTAILRQRVRQRRQQKVNHNDQDQDNEENEQVAQLQQRLDKAEAETRAAQQATRLVQADMHDKIQQSQATLRIQMAHLEQALATVQRDRDTIEQRTLDQMRQQYHAIDDPNMPSNDADSLRLQAIELESRCTRMQKNHDQERLRLQRAVDNATDRQTQAEYAVQGLKTSLSVAEKTVAELELKLEVAKSMAKKQQEEQQAKLVQADHTTCRQSELNLQREIAAQQAEIGRLERSLQQLSEQHQCEIAAEKKEIAHLQQSLQQLSEQQQRERGVWEQRLREEFSALYYHEKEAYKVQVSREMRMLANKLAEQDADIESMERRQQQDAKAVATAESMRRAIEARCNEKRVAWEDEEKKLKMTIVGLEQKVSRLEQDALQLYSRNLKLAHQLGQCAP